MINDLLCQREEVDREIESILEELKETDIGVDEPLIDAEGFPLHSVDILRVCSLRKRLTELRNDQLRIQTSLEKLLLDESSESSSTLSIQNGHHRTPFAKILTVIDNSPAQEAGLSVGDLVIRFGPESKESLESADNVEKKMQRLQACVLKKKPIVLCVQKSNIGDLDKQSDKHDIDVTWTILKPMENWGGVGLTGFKLQFI